MIKIAIIGSGPAGIACAKTLVNTKENFFEITIFEELNEFGGMLAYGLPEFRLPLTQVKQNIFNLKEKNVKFIKKKVSLIKNLLKTNGGEFDFVILAIGGGEGTKIGLVGEDSEKIIDALELLKKSKLERINLLKKNESVAIIGGGNSAIDAARLAKRQCDNVSLIYRRTEEQMPAFGNELQMAKDEGIKFEFLKAPIEYFDKNNKIFVKLAKMKLGEKDASGRERPIETGEKVIQEFDKIILAIGQKNNLTWLEKEGVNCAGGRIIVDENGETTIPNVFAIGDCVTGPKNIASATKNGIKVAQTILKKT